MTTTTHDIALHIKQARASEIEDCLTDLTEVLDENVGHEDSAVLRGSIPWAAFRARLYRRAINGNHQAAQLHDLIGLRIFSYPPAFTNDSEGETP